VRAAFASLRKRRVSFISPTDSTFWDGPFVGSSPRCSFSRPNVVAWASWTEIRARIRAHNGHTARLPADLTPRIRGWATYHRHACSRQVLERVDWHIDQALRRRCHQQHRHKNAMWFQRRPMRCSVPSILLRRIDSLGERRSGVEGIEVIDVIEQIEFPD